MALSTNAKGLVFLHHVYSYEFFWFMSYPITANTDIPTFQIRKMGVSYSTARWLAPLSFVVDFAAQSYGMLSTPNMKDIHDANLSFFSPQPYFIAGFFAPQQVFQLIWLYRLWKGGREPAGLGADQDDVPTMVDYSPYYALGNFCIACGYFLLWGVLPVPH